MLNPMRSGLAKAGLEAHGRTSSFGVRAEAEVASFHAFRADLEQQVRRGDLTVKVARERAAAFADRAKADLKREADGFSPTPRAFLDRLVEAADARKLARDSASLEALQRETNRLLRQSVVEMQLVARRDEFEGKAFFRPMAGGAPAPTLASLLTLDQLAATVGDEVAREWTRRQLEAIRPLVHEPDELRRIDLACDRPDAVNLRLVDSYLAALEGQGPDACKIFVERAIEAGDANACVASFLLARRADPEATDLAASRATRAVLGNLAQFPDAALATLRAWEADARAQDAEAAQAQVAFAAARLDAESRLATLEAPSPAEVDRRTRIQGRPVAQPGEAIGLTLACRGRMPGDAPSELPAAPGDANADVIATTDMRAAGPVESSASSARSF